MKTLRYFLIPFLMLAVLGACSSAVATQEIHNPQSEIGKPVAVSGGGQYVDIQPSELKALLEEKDFLLINVKVPYMGHIEGTDAFIPYNQIQDHLAELPESKSDMIVIYCRTGRSSAIAAQTLVGLGYTNVYNLAGGFEAWQAAGYPLLHGE
jgi:rhodanese-related sulfurtransferase